MKYFVKSITIVAVTILLTLIISKVTLSSEFSAEELLKEAYKNQHMSN